MEEARLIHGDDLSWEPFAKHRGVSMATISGNEPSLPFKCYEVTVEPGGEVYPHTHEDGVTDVSYILDGEAAVLVNGERVRGQAGSCLIAPAGVEHGMKNVGQTPLRILAVLVGAS